MAWGFRAWGFGILGFRVREQGFMSQELRTPLLVQVRTAKALRI